MLLELAKLFRRGGGFGGRSSASGLLQMLLMLLDCGRWSTPAWLPALRSSFSLGCGCEALSVERGGDPLRTATPAASTGCACRCWMRAGWSDSGLAARGRASAGKGLGRTRQSIRNRLLVVINQTLLNVTLVKITVGRKGYGIRMRTDAVARNRRRVRHILRLHVLGHSSGVQRLRSRCVPKVV